MLLYNLVAYQTAPLTVTESIPRRAGASKTHPVFEFHQESRLWAMAKSINAFLTLLLASIAIVQHATTYASTSLKVKVEPVLCKSSTHRRRTITGGMEIPPECDILHIDYFSGTADGPITSLLPDCPASSATGASSDACRYCSDPHDSHSTDISGYFGHDAASSGCAPDIARSLFETAVALATFDQGDDAYNNNSLCLTRTSAYRDDGAVWAGDVAESRMQNAFETLLCEPACPSADPWSRVCETCVESCYKASTNAHCNAKIDACTRFCTREKCGTEPPVECMETCPQYCSQAYSGCADHTDVCVDGEEKSTCLICVHGCVGAYQLQQQLYECREICSEEFEGALRVCGDGRAAQEAFACTLGAEEGLQVCEVVCGDTVEGLVVGDGVPEAGGGI